MFTMNIEKIFIINKREITSKDNKQLYLIDLVAKNSSNSASFSQFTTKDVFDKISNILSTSSIIEIPSKYLVIDIINNKINARVDLKSYTDFSNK